MIATYTTKKPARQALVTLVLDDAQHTVGRISQVGRKSFRASRKHGQVGVDIRRYAEFRSEAAALAFVLKQSSDAESAAAAAAICAGPGPAKA